MGIILPLRAYHYAGSFPALYYYPVYLIWNSPLSARALGLVFLCAGAFFAARTFRFKFKYVALGLLLFFPYAFQHVVDTGPVGLHVLSIYVIYALMDRWCATLHKRYISAITVLIFLCIWTKFSYFWMAPGIFSFFLIHVCRHRKFLWTRENLFRLISQSAVAASMLTILVGSLLLSTSPSNSSFKPYLHELLISKSHTLPDLWDGIWWFSGVVWALLHPLEATHRIFIVATPGLAERLYARILFLFVPTMLIVLGIDSYGRKKDSLLALVQPLVLYLAFLVTVITIARTMNAGVMHHAMLSLPFLILAILSTIRCALDSNLPKLLMKRSLVTVCIVFLGINLIFFAKFPTQQLRNHDHHSKQLAHRILNTGTVSERFTVLIVDWGTYFYEGLYGSPQKSTIMLEGMNDPNLLVEIRNEVRKNNRKLIVMYLNDHDAVRWQEIQSSFPLATCSGMPKSAPWQILYEPDKEMKKVCSNYEKAVRNTSTVKQISLRASLLF